MKSTQPMSHDRGTIMAVDSITHIVTIKSLVMNKTFQVAADAEIAHATGEHCSLDELHNGERVDVYYENTGPIHIAHRILQLTGVGLRKAA